MTHTIARSGALPLQFAGELVAESESGVDDLRGYDLDLYRTASGKFVVSVLYWTMAPA